MSSLARNSWSYIALYIPKCLPQHVSVTQHLHPALIRVETDPNALADLMEALFHPGFWLGVVAFRPVAQHEAPARCRHVPNWVRLHVLGVSWHDAWLVFKY